LLGASTGIDREQQVPPLRYAPVPRQAGTGGMTIWFQLEDLARINNVTASPTAGRGRQDDESVRVLMKNILNKLANQPLRW
jgi:hypothetical protein